MKVWITRWALSKGIIELTGAKVRPVNRFGIVDVELPSGAGYGVSPDDVSYSREEALTQANWLRRTRIAKHKRAAARLERLVVQVRAEKP